MWNCKLLWSHKDSDSEAEWLVARVEQRICIEQSQTNIRKLDLFVTGNCQLLT